MDTYYTPNDAYKKDMGRRLRKYRKQANLTQEKMAEILNVSIKHYSEVERGIIGVSVQKLLFISNYFGLQHLWCSQLRYPGSQWYAQDGSEQHRGQTSVRILSAEHS